MLSHLRDPRVAVRIILSDFLNDLHPALNRHLLVNDQDCYRNLIELHLTCNFYASVYCFLPFAHEITVFDQTQLGEY